jgi:hypothetical protein
MIATIDDIFRAILDCLVEEKPLTEVTSAGWKRCDTAGLETCAAWAGDPRDAPCLPQSSGSGRNTFGNTLKDQSSTPPAQRIAP